jgi:hypothetical protein
MIEGEWHNNTKLHKTVPWDYESGHVNASIQSNVRKYLAIVSNWDYGQWKKNLIPLSTK